MNRQHLIDHAEFDTTFVAGGVSPDQQGEIDEFIKHDLMKIIDDVFDDIERKYGANPSGLSLQRLEIDLGKIELADYRQQMSLCLRRQLWQALDNARYTTGSRISINFGQDGASVDDSALFYYLRYGYLPSAATVAGAEELETQLQRLVETGSARLAEFFAEAARKDEVIERLKAQFSTPLVEQVLQLLESLHLPAAPAGAADPASMRADRQAKLEQLLLAGKQAPLQSFLQRLMQDDSEMLADILRDIGNQAIHRQKLTRLLSVRQFAGLVRLLEPAAHDIVSSVLDPGHWLATLAHRSSVGSAERDIKLREYLLGYLLVEAGDRFEAEKFVASLLGQIAASSAQPRAELCLALTDKLEEAAQADGISGELARLMQVQVERLASRPIVRWTDVYRRYARVEALFLPAANRHPDAQLLADIDLLLKQAPWLLMRLLRELQSGGDRRGAVQDLSAPVLGKLSYSFVALINQAAGSESSAANADPFSAMWRKVESMPDPRACYVEIMTCLISGAAIDFDAIGAFASVAEAGGEPEVAEAPDSVAAASSAAIDLQRRDAIESLPQDDPRTAQLLQFAEQLTLASLAIGLKLSASQLQTIKWRFVESYAAAGGNLFNAKRFVRGFVAGLLDQAGVSGSSEFYSMLGQALLRNSLPATRDSTRRIIEQLDDIAAESALPVDFGSAQAEQTETAIVDQPFDQLSPDEDIHIDNAGLALLAPWLPRLFDQLGFVEDGVFRGRDAAERAVHCLQFLIDGSVSSPEYRLVLNKLLCGVRPGQPIRRRIELSADETGLLESLLEAVTLHWKALENTSIEGLRESFLQRGGRLQLKQNAWHLAVEARSFDMLLDQVPWSYTTIKFAWMDRVIYVEWR